MGEIDALGSDPLVQTLVELFIVHVERRTAFSRGDGKNLSLSIFAVLPLVSRPFNSQAASRKAHLLYHSLDADSASTVSTCMFPSNRDYYYRMFARP